MAHLVSSSTAMVLSEKHKCTLPCAIQMKNLRKSVSIKEKLHLISWLEKWWTGGWDM